MYTKYNPTDKDNRQRAFCKANFQDKFERFQQRFFDDEASSSGSHSQSAGAGVAANILENGDYFEIQLFAPGRKKEAFKIELDQHVLQIAYEDRAESDDVQYMHREYWPTAFKRAFQLNEQVLTDAIHASFEEGVLTVIIPKDPNVSNAVKAVKID